MLFPEYTLPFPKAMALRGLVSRAPQIRGQLCNLSLSRPRHRQARRSLRLRSQQYRALLHQRVNAAQQRHRDQALIVGQHQQRNSMPLARCSFPGVAVAPCSSTSAFTKSKS